MLVSAIGPDVNGAVYVAPDGSMDVWKTPYIACGGAVLIGGGGSVGAPGGLTDRIETQMRSAPIVLPTGQTRASVPCPFCAQSDIETIVDVRLDAEESERRTFCGRDGSSHPLLIIRQPS